MCEHDVYSVAALVSWAPVVYVHGSLLPMPFCSRLSQSVNCHSQLQQPALAPNGGKKAASGLTRNYPTQSLQMELSWSHTGVRPLHTHTHTQKYRHEAAHFIARLKKYVGLNLAKYVCLQHSAII